LGSPGKGITDPYTAYGSRRMARVIRAGVKMERLEFGKRHRISELLKYLHIRINY
jgi:hypothetical protein